jgi:hypothetical protein
LILRSMLIGSALLLAPAPSRASVPDAQLCFATSDRVADGEAVTEDEKRAGHEACQRALAATASIVQKYQLQEADFDIVGRPPKPAN